MLQQPRMGQGSCVTQGRAAGLVLLPSESGQKEIRNKTRIAIKSFSV